MPGHTKRPVKPNGRKSSLAARRLIRAALARYHTERAAARALGLPNHGQLNKMRHGWIKDTPAMRAAIKRAAARAQRAFCFLPAVVSGDDTLAPRLEELKRLAQKILELLEIP